MKKIIYIYLLLITIVANSQISGTLNSFSTGLELNEKNFNIINNYSSDTMWIYKIMERYEWDGNNYLHVVSEIGEYNNILFPDKMTRGYGYYPITGDTLSKTDYFYDSIGQKSKTISQLYDTLANTWNNTMMIQYFYNSNGTDTCFIEKLWDVDSNNWINEMRYVEDYDTNGYRTLFCSDEWKNNKWYRYEGTKYKFDDKECMDTAFWYMWVPDVIGHWQKYLIKIWHYDECGELYEYIYKRWHESEQEWVNYQKFTDIEHIDWQGCNNYDYEFVGYETPVFSKYTFYHWMNNHWEPIKRSIYASIDSLGGFHYELQEWNEGEWKDSFIVDRGINDKGIIIYNKVQVNENYQGVWKIVFADTVILEYDGPRLIKYEVKVLDTTGGVQKWVPLLKDLFKDYFYVLNTDEKTIMAQDSAVSIIPNPSKNSIEIKLNNEADRIKTVKVYNVAGQRVLNKNYHGKSRQESLYISSLKNGVYIVNVTTKEGRTLKTKFIKN